jgi:hypothetical protein
MQPLRLNGDVVLPAGSYVAVPGAIQATTAKDGSALPFQPFQWAEKRASAERDHTEVKLGYVFSGYVCLFSHSIPISYNLCPLGRKRSNSAPDLTPVLGAFLLPTPSR